MNNYKLKIAYEGSRYNGWQKQNDTPNTIQQILNDLINEYINEKTKLIGSGRTDAGVHALGQIVNFRCEKKCDEKDMLNWLNSNIPEDIKILECEKVSNDFHSRHSCKGKKYLYRIDNRDIRNPFEKKYSWRVEETLDIDYMTECAKVLCGEHDFSAFCTDAKLMPYTVKNLYEINITKDFSCLKNERVPGIVEIEFYGSGFLYNMVRILAGTLVDASLHRFTKKQIEDMLLVGKRSESGQLAPAKGLFLKEVIY